MRTSRFRYRSSPRRVVANVPRPRANAEYIDPDYNLELNSVPGFSRRDLAEKASEQEMPPVGQGGRVAVEGAGPTGTGQWGSGAAARGHLKQRAIFITGKKDLVIWSPESAVRYLCRTQNLR